MLDRWGRKVCGGWCLEDCGGDDGYLGLVKDGLNVVDKLLHPWVFLVHGNFLAHDFDLAEFLEIKVAFLLNLVNENLLLSIEFAQSSHFILKTRSVRGSLTELGGHGGR